MATQDKPPKEVPTLLNLPPTYLEWLPFLWSLPALWGWRPVSEYTQEASALTQQDVCLSWGTLFLFLEIKTFLSLCDYISYTYPN